MMTRTCLTISFLTTMMKNPMRIGSEMLRAGDIGLIRMTPAFMMPVLMMARRTPVIPAKKHFPAQETDPAEMKAEMMSEMIAEMIA